MDNKKLAKLAVDALKREYPSAKCSLEYTDPFELLVATRLAAQCTDARVNMVTPALFARFRSVHDFAEADASELEGYISSCGLYKTKARDIINMAKVLISDFCGIVPDNIDDLTKLPGVGRKTANLIVGDIFKKPSVVVDTHCIRITRLLGFHDIKDPYKIENILRDALDEDESSDFCHRLVLHGRDVCVARRPKCDVCCMNAFCKHALENSIHKD